MSKAKIKTGHQVGCQNCGALPAPCLAAARAFANGTSTKFNTVWGVCKACRWLASEAARWGKANHKDWTGRAGVPA